MRHNVENVIMSNDTPAQAIKIQPPTAPVRPGQQDDPRDDFWKEITRHGDRLRDLTERTSINRFNDRKLS